MKIEISEDTYRLVDGEEDSDNYVTGTVVPFGEESVLEKDGEADWTALIDEAGCCDGQAHQGGVSVPVEFELGCEFDEDDED